MRREELYLAEILDACDKVGRWLDGVDLNWWAGDGVLRYAVAHQPTVWSVAAQEMPRLRSEVAAVFQQEFPGAWQLFLKED